MNILDENVLKDQRELLTIWHIPVRQIGFDMSRKGIKDQEIIPLLMQQHQATFFTLDFDFYKRTLSHLKYCLVYLDIEDDEAAHHDWQKSKGFLLDWFNVTILSP